MMPISESCLPLSLDQPPANSEKFSVFILCLQGRERRSRGGRLLRISDHLIASPQQGLYFRRDVAADWASALLALAGRAASLPEPDRQARRSRLAEYAQWLRYDRIVDGVLRQLAERLAAGDDDERARRLRQFGLTRQADGASASAAATQPDQ